MGLQTAEADPPRTSRIGSAVSRRYAWVVFALSLGLMLSDYMSRQVLNAVFPLLKADWLLSDAQLGSLSSIVALMVGVLTFPLSLLADRLGRVRCMVMAAVTWSVATVGCAVSAGYGEMFLARFLVGVGEAAYGSVGIAVVLSVFTVRLRATVSGAFMAGGPFGSVLGVSLGGVIAQGFGWRWAFGVIGIFGLVLALVYGVVVRERRQADQRTPVGDHAAHESGARTAVRAQLSRLFSSVSVLCAYVGSGIQLFVPLALLAWMPSFLNRYYAMPPAHAGMVAGLFALITGVGLLGGGMLSDSVSRTAKARKWTVAIVCSLGSLVLLMAGFQLPPGPVQLGLIAAGTLLSNATASPAVAMVAELTPPALAATAFATLTLANNLFGIAPAPVVTGFLADRLGLLGALRVMPLVAIAASLAFAVGRFSFLKDLRRLGLRSDADDQSGH